VTTGDRVEQFEGLLDYLTRSRGFDFTAYKRSSLERRIQKRMHAANLEGYADYCDYLDTHPAEFALLFNTILINVTSFFRDPESWDYLRSAVIPAVLDSREGDAAIRVWSAGCSSGEEAYSLAMILADTLGVDQFHERVKIYATDVDEEALNQGRLGSYADHAIASVPPALVEKYFEKSNGRYLFNRDLRRSLIFGRHDLILDPPISRISLLTCRNTLMYFNGESQQRILDRFHFGLRDSGYLFLGKAEMLLTRSSQFTPVDLKRRVFTKVFRPQFQNGVPMPVSRGHEGKTAASRADRLRELAFQTDPTAQIVLDQSHTIVFANEGARALFGLTATDVGRPLEDFEISYRPAELRSLIDQAADDGRPVSLKDVAWTLPSGERLYFDVQVIPMLDSTQEMLGTKVLFDDVTRYHRLQEDLKTSHQELETANEELLSTNEELETTNEELQSTVEELETTNEELQSTNEELETMNEELQSTNEELQTSNEQLRQSGDSLNRANAFLETVLSNFHEGLVVVDAELRVQAWNAQAEELWGLRSAEVQSKHLMSLDIGLPVALLDQPLRRCLSGASQYEQLTVTAINRRGRTIEVDVSCTPFSLGKNATWGAIVMMEDKSRRTEIRKT
jgi:two-component system, chemotaxis family, CheB/CheR fusion protein